MKLYFDTYLKGRYIGVNVWIQSEHSDIIDNIIEYTNREYLEESQYDQIAKWCAKTFNTDEQRLRVRRMSYADFWFSSQRDLDWFILYWSGVDSNSF